MARLLLTDELCRTFLGGLLSVCRADTEVNLEELSALRLVADELTAGGGYDAEALLFSQVTPRSFAEALLHDDAGPFRTAGRSGVSVVAQAFIKASLRVSRADGDLNEAEIRSICAFARALGTSPSVLRDLDAALDDAPPGTDN